jgi:hypothetical protein
MGILTKEIVQRAFDAYLADLKEDGFSCCFIGQAANPHGRYDDEACLEWTQFWSGQDRSLFWLDAWDAGATFAERRAMRLSMFDAYINERASDIERIRTLIRESNRC